MKMDDNIKSLFEPRSVAVIGASTHTSKIGYKLLENITDCGFEGKIYPVNPKGGKILGLPVYKSICDAETEIDIACIAVPSQFVFDSVRECAEKKVRNLVIITSGFSEIGNREEENRIRDFARENKMRILGPNIFGIYSAKQKLNATFGPKNILPGMVSIITQSGAIGIAMIGRTALENIGLSSIISVGNKSDIDEADLLEYLICDEATKLILMYIEGIKDGVRFIDAVRRATRVKPVIVIKSGRSARGAMAAASHTGSLAGADQIFDAIMRQCGVIRAESIEEAFDWCIVLTSSPPLHGENSVIVTNGGGIGVLATDACEKYGIKLFDNASVLAEAFRGSVPEFGSTKNPVDLTGQATENDYRNALLAALKSPEFHSVISLYCETAMMDDRSLSTMLEDISARYRSKKPIVFSLFGGAKVNNCVEYVRRRGIPAFTGVYNTVSALASVFHTKKAMEHVSEEIAEISIDTEKADKVIDMVLDDGRNFLLSHEAKDLMQASDIPVAESYVAKNIEQAIEYAGKIKYPVVLKVVSRDILHKSDAGGVALHLDNRQEVIDAYEAILHNCYRYNKNARIDGIEVCRMVLPGVEVITGARRDRVFGPVVMFGLGGIYVEVMKDVTFRSLPLSRREANEMISEIKSYPILLGVRGEESRDISAILDTIIKVSNLLLKCDRITDIEVNPLVAYEQGQGCLAVDARILVSGRSKQP
jgi:acetyltransferase